VDAEFLVVSFVLVEFLPTCGFDVFTEIQFINEDKLFDGGFTRPDDEERSTRARGEKSERRGRVSGKEFVKFAVFLAIDPQAAVPYHGAIAKTAAGESDGVPIFCGGWNGIGGDGFEVRLGTDGWIVFDGFADLGEQVVGDGNLWTETGFASGALDELLHQVVCGNKFLEGGARGEAGEGEQ